MDTSCYSRARRISVSVGSALGWLSQLAVFVLACVAGRLNAGLILNEYNAVGTDKYLEGAGQSGDTFFGYVRGNGGNWFELVVVEDHLDIRGWRMEWSWYDDAQNRGGGVIKVSDSPVFANLRAGTLVTFIEDDTAGGGLDTDTVVYPEVDDWWLNVCVGEHVLVETEGAFVEDGIERTLADGEFQVNNDNWVLTIKDADGNLVFGPAGEGSEYWPGSGVNSRETARLQTDPSPWVHPGSEYSDGETSTFGAPNDWDAGVNTQDFSRLRTVAPERPRISRLYSVPDSEKLVIEWNGFNGQPYLIQSAELGVLSGKADAAWRDILHLTGGDNPISASLQLERESRGRLYRVVIPGAAQVEPLFALNHASSWFAEGPRITLDFQNEQALVRFTTDGSVPTLESELFQGELGITNNTVVRLRAFPGGRLPGETETVFLGVGEQPALPVMALVTEPSNLFDPETGIYENPMNRGRDWERPVETVFLGDAGDSNFQVGAGLRIAGQYSRNHDKKSFRLYFRGDYGPRVMNRVVFSDKPDVDEFDVLVVRSGATDQYVDNWSLIRDPLLHRLYAETGGYYAACEFVHLYINSEYWGIYTLRERVDENYLLANFGSEDVDLIKFENESPVAEVGDMSAWNEMTNFFNNAEPANEDDYSQAAEYWDLRDFTDYQIFEIYSGNQDWPHNNVYAFRERVDDAQWRFILWDMDLTMGLPWWDIDHVFHDTLAWATRSQPEIGLAPPWLQGEDGREDQGRLLWSTLILRKLLENPAYRVRFINRFADLLNSTLSYDNVESELSRLESLLSSEIRKEEVRWDKPVGQWDTNIEQIRRFAELRPGFLREKIAERFNLPGLTTVRLSVSGGGGNVRINSVEANPLPWEGVYFRSVPVTVSAAPDEGYEFAGWINSGLPDSETLFLTPTNSLIELEAAFQQK
ncbi:MAG: CotH kinase family protein [Verrucomicrobia bacterium]|nr:CotH kinase family protein [Verrucomicrobiota bacterium]MCF7707615.1 CotH kinase family protein [Verrucomicrobiota bacterium]